jgi:hypothetical protein
MLNIRAADGENMDRLLASSAIDAPVGRDTAPLRIDHIEAIPVALPLKKPVVMAGERIERAYNLLVRIEAENGLIGWGEAASAPLMKMRFVAQSLNSAARTPFSITLERSAQ